MSIFLWPFVLSEGFAYVLFLLTRLLLIICINSVRLTLLWWFWKSYWICSFLEKWVASIVLILNLMYWLSKKTWIRFWVMALWRLWSSSSILFTEGQIWHSSLANWTTNALFLLVCVKFYCWTWIGCGRIKWLLFTDWRITIVHIYWSLRFWLSLFVFTQRFSSSLLWIELYFC